MSEIGQFNLGHYKITQMLGYGANGTVHLAKDTTTGELVAIKELSFKGLTPAEQHLQRNEAFYHSSLSHHENILTLRDVMVGEEALFLVMDYCPEGDLFEFVVKQTNADRLKGVESSRRMALEIISSVINCHSAGIYHRDLKPENVLLVPCEDGSYTTRLADFGLATTQLVSNDLGCGSACYMSPECTSYSPQHSEKEGFNSAKNDVWSLGILLVNLMCGLNPWKRACVEDRSFAAYLRDQTYLMTLEVSSSFYELLTKALNPDPEARCDLDTLYNLVKACPTFLLSQHESSSSLTMSSSTYLFSEAQLMYDAEEMDDSDSSCHTLSSPTCPTFDHLPEHGFDKETMYALYFDDQMSPTQTYPSINSRFH